MKLNKMQRGGEVFIYAVVYKSKMQINLSWSFIFW